MAWKSNMKSLLAPKSVAVMGATRRPLHGTAALQNLLNYQFAGPVYPINSRYDDILGVKCYPDFRSLPSVPECAILAIPSRAVVGALREAGEVGVRAAVIYSAGFAEIGDEGRRLQEELAEVAHRYDMAVCGPNCLGLANFVAPVTLYGAALPADLPRGRIGIIAQSGSICFGLMLMERLACSYAISSGNQAVVDSTDYLEYLVEDPDTSVIAMFVETIRQPRAFLAAVARAHALKKPIVICKPGKSERGADATMAHTGTLAGSYEVYASICQQYGLIRVNDVDEMIEVLTLLSSVRHIPRCAGLGMVNFSGGENALFLDIAQELGLSVPSPTQSTANALRSSLPAFAAVNNPLDVTGALYYDNPSHRRCLEALANDEGVGTMIVVQDLMRRGVQTFQSTLFEPIVGGAIELARNIDKPVIVLTTISDDVDSSFREPLARVNVPVLQGLRKGMQAVGQFVNWAEYLRHFEESGGLEKRLRGMDMKRDLPNGLTDALAASRGPVGESLAKAVLGSYGLPVTREVLARDVQSAVAAADKIGYPVVVKIDSPDILHKTDVGGVRVGLANAEAVTAACDEVLESVSHRVPKARINGFLVQEMVVGGIEVVLGMKRDDSFGPMVLFGLGGVFVEVMRAFALRQAPLNRMEAEAMICEIPGAQLLRGVRGMGPSDVDALITTLEMFSQFCLDAGPVLREIDLNPVMVLPEGQGVRIVDALMIP